MNGCHMLLSCPRSQTPCGITRPPWIKTLSSLCNRPLHSLLTYLPYRSVALFALNQQLGSLDDIIGVRVHKVLEHNLRLSIDLQTMEGTEIKDLLLRLKAKKDHQFFSRHLEIKANKPLSISWSISHPQVPGAHWIFHDNSTHCGLVMAYGDRSGATLAQVMAWCLTAPSHYLKLCWLSSMGLCGTQPRLITQEVLKISICKFSLKNTIVKLLPHLSEANELNLKDISSY